MEVIQRFFLVFEGNKTANNDEMCVSVDGIFSKQ